jgi:hypothetical protein
MAQDRKVLGLLFGSKRREDDMIPLIIMAAKALKGAKAAKGAQGAAKGAQGAKGAAETKAAPTFKAQMADAGREYLKNTFGKDAQKPQDAQLAPLPQYHKGGKVRKTGIAKLKKGEEVLTAKESRLYHGKESKNRLPISAQSFSRIYKAGKKKNSATKKGSRKRVLVK